MSPAAVPPPALTCSVLGESQGRSLVFRGQIVSRDAADGTYRLRIEKIGPGGRSQIAQGGAFAAKPGETVLVGSTMVSVEPGSQVEAHLQLTVDGRTIDCVPYTGEPI